MNSTVAAASDLAREVRRALADGPPAVGVVVLESDGGDPPTGGRLLVRAGDVEGSLGNPEADRLAVREARALLQAGGGPRTIELATGCTAYLEPYRPADTLVIVGAGHIARPLCTVAHLLGFRVTVLDDRPDFATRERFAEASEVHRVDFTDPFRETRIGAGTYVVLVTRGHKYDFEALRDLLAREELPAYIGMVGSRRRVRACFEQLAAEDVPPEVLARVHAPIGLDIGAETPAEIAVCIAAELVQLQRGGTGAPLRQKERVVERWIGKPDKGS